MKRRPWWSDNRHLAALLLGGLLLIAPPTSGVEAEAATAQAKSAKKAAPAAKKPRRQRGLATDIGQAEIIESETTGLHGQASYYGHGFSGRRTATGEIFDTRLFTAASNRFPLGTLVAVRRLDNDRCAIVKINDRMHAKHRRRIIDVSRGVADYLDMVRSGVVMVRVAKLPKVESRQNQDACLAAFDPTPQCSACLPDADGQPEKMPDFLGVER